jgi:benzodiazapine receptor
MNNTVPLVFFLAVCLGVSAVGGWITQTSVNDWYQTLIKPSMNPPDWVFAPTWITLYVMMAVAGWRVWLRPENSLRRMAMVAFAIQLMLNLIWSFIFFGAKSPGFAAIEIVLGAEVAKKLMRFYNSYDVCPQKQTYAASAKQVD